jgi:hypothetical protein
LSTIGRLVKKDLLNDFRHPWGILVLMSIPVLISLIMALVFSPGDDIQENVTLHVALLDNDGDLISGFLRSIGNQGDTDQNLQFQMVDSLEQGIKLVEKRKVSAFVVLPENMTKDLLDNKPVTLPLYKNPAESILPRIIEEGLEILCITISEGLDLLGPEMSSLWDMLDRDEMPDALEVAALASGSVERLQTVEPYLFPPLIQFETVEISGLGQEEEKAPEVQEDSGQ